MIFFAEKKEKLRQWFTARAESPNAKWWLSLISFTESSFFPIPTDPFLMAILLVQRAKWLSLSILTTVTSVLGGAFGYLIGFAFFATLGEPIVDFYGLHEEMQKISEFFNDNAFFAIFTAAFTPIPYKIFTISAGLFQISFVTFIIASLLGRGIRYLIVGYIMKVFGRIIGELVFKYFNAVSMIFVVVIVGYVIFSIYS